MKRKVTDIPKSPDIPTKIQKEIASYSIYFTKIITFAPYYQK